MPNIADDERELDNGEIENGPEDDEVVEGVEEGDETAEGVEDADAEGEDVLAADEDTPRQPTRGEKRFQALSKSTREAHERAERLERELNEFKAQQRQPAQQGESPEQEAARLALMTPEERIEYRLDKAQRETAGKMARLEFLQQDQNDRADFLAKVASDPHLARVAGKVESKLAELRAKGQNPMREVIATYMLGEMVRTANAKAVQKQKTAAGKRVASQTTQPSSGRGDVAPGRRKTGSTPEDRLDGVSI